MGFSDVHIHLHLQTFGNRNTNISSGQYEKVVRRLENFNVIRTVIGKGCNWAVTSQKLRVVKYFGDGDGPQTD